MVFTGERSIRPFSITKCDTISCFICTYSSRKSCSDILAKVLDEKYPLWFEEKRCSPPTFNVILYKNTSATLLKGSTSVVSPENYSDGFENIITCNITTMIPSYSHSWSHTGEEQTNKQPFAEANRLNPTKSNVSEGNRFLVFSMLICKTNKNNGIWSSTSTRRMLKSCVLFSALARQMLKERLGTLQSLSMGCRYILSCSTISYLQDKSRTLQKAVLFCGSAEMLFLILVLLRAAEALFWNGQVTSLIGSAFKTSLL